MPLTARIRVALDAEHERQSNAGTARCARELKAALEKRDDIDVITVGGGPTLQRRTMKKRMLTARQDFWWYPAAGRRRAGRLGAHIYHCPTPRGPLSAGSPPLVVTVHDLASLRHPETLTRWTRFYERVFLPRLVQAADRIIVPSADTGHDVATLLGVPATKIRVVHNGVDSSFFSVDESPREFDFPYVLFVGTPQPRKNLERLSAAVDLLSAGPRPVQLLIAGADGWGDVNVRSANAHFLGRVSDERLRRLYRDADSLALVSLHEGFGLPAIEAMAAGAPVVAANAGALPEVVGSAAVLVDPLDVNSIARGIVEARERRTELVERGRVRALEFSWDAAAERTVSVYRELLWL